MAILVERLGARAVRAWASGRATLMGDHTDYNYGCSLAGATSRGTAVIASYGTGKVSSSVTDASASLSGWRRYPEACFKQLRGLGMDVTGIDLEISSDLPIGKGLSSSTALVFAILTAASELLGSPLALGHLKSAARQVENDWLGIPSGVLDQEVIPLDGCEAVKIDFATGLHESVRIPQLGGHDFWIVDPGEPRSLGPSNIGARRTDCARAIRAIGEKDDAAGWRRLTAMSDQDVAARLESSDGDPSTYRKRLRHVVSENRRVDEMVRALDAADVDVIGALLNDSHNSLRDDFGVSTARVEAARDRLCSIAAVKGSRIVGAGFGGCLLVLAGRDARLDLPSFRLRPAAS